MQPRHCCQGVQTPIPIQRKKRRQHRLKQVQQTFSHRPALRPAFTGGVDNGLKFHQSTPGRYPPGYSLLSYAINTTILIYGHQFRLIAKLLCLCTSLKQRYNLFSNFKINPLKYLHYLRKMLSLHYRVSTMVLSRIYPATWEWPGF